MMKATKKNRILALIGCAAASLMTLTVESCANAKSGMEGQEVLMQGNPYLPLWEHTPDGEPYIFEDPDQPGKMRVYIYGSHDIELTGYCGRDQVVWSASVDSLTNWRYDGVIFKVDKNRDGGQLNTDGKGDILFAPDVCCLTGANGKKTYYLFPNVQAEGRSALIAKSNRPDGPFEVCNWSKEEAGKVEGDFVSDPAVLVDDDGRIYAYWGFMQSMAGEMDPDNLAALKPGTEAMEDMISNLKQPGVFRFFEASSIRKIKDKYVFIYSRWTEDGEFGLPGTNYTLAYCYGDHPLGPWTYGGTIIDARGRDINEQGDTIVTATPSANTHGSILEINGQWYVFYHRQTGTTEFARQAMVSPITVNVEEGTGGKVEISEAEYTSEGFSINGLNPLQRYSAGIACWYTAPKAWKPGDSFYLGSYIEASYGTDDKFQNPYDLRNNMNRVVNNNDGSIVGYKYFNFDATKGRKDVRLNLQLMPEGLDGIITIMVDRPWTSQGGKVLGTIDLKADMPQSSMTMTATLPELGELSGKHALFFVFSSSTKDKSICTLESLGFE